MKSKKILRGLYIVAVCYLISACSLNFDPNCIPPEADENYSKSYDDPRNEENPPKILPKGDWELVADLPFAQEKSPYYIYAGESIWTFVIRSGHELWMRNGYDGDKILRYDIDTGNWKTYQTIGEHKFVPDQLFVAKDNTLWGIGVANLEYELHTKIPSALSWYNPVTDRFEFVIDKDRLLTSQWHSSQIREASKGILWFELYSNEDKNRLVSFDPVTQKAEVQFLAYSMNIGLYGFEIGSDNSLWIIDAPGSLVRYFPDTKKIVKQKVYVGGDEWGDLSFDHSGRLWIQDRGWYDFSQPNEPIWHDMKRSTVFIHLVKGETYGWNRPHRMYQTSNGIYWFESIVGLVRFDLEKGEWCRFTTGQSPVLEDAKGNLWIVIFSKLYKLIKKS